MASPSVRVYANPVTLTAPSSAAPSPRVYAAPVTLTAPAPPPSGAGPSVRVYAAPVALTAPAPEPEPADQPPIMVSRNGSPWAPAHKLVSVNGSAWQ